MLEYVILFGNEFELDLCLLGSKVLGFYVFRTLIVLLANHDQNNVFRSV